MKIAFTKMQACGNDYIYIDATEAMPAADPSRLARAMSPRRFSVGADGVVFICTSAVADARMRIFNADGSEAEICGNALRCVARYMRERLRVIKDVIKIETLSGIHTVRAESDGKYTVTVSRAVPDLHGFCGADTENKRAARFLDGDMFYTVPVSVGNPHLVAFAADVDTLDVPRLGAAAQKEPDFPQGVNAEFVEILGKNRLKMRVYERGSGETFACGSGAAAATIAAVTGGFADFDKTVCVEMRGGDLMTVCHRDFTVAVTGNADFVYNGVYEYDNVCDASESQD